jgi:hypothetical protein
MDKMNESLKNIIRNTIELEFTHVQEDKFQEVEDTEEYKEISKRSGEIYRILCDKLPKELKDLFMEYEGKETALMCLKEQYYYKQGVISGLTNLKFLEEYGLTIQTL